MHHTLTLCYLLGSVLEWSSIWISILTSTWAANIEGSHHMFPPDMTNHHFERQALWVWIFFEDLGDLTL